MKTKYIFQILTAFLMLISIDVLALDGDTLKIRTIEFQARRLGWFDMPEANNQFQRILMNYKLRCPPGKPCGEWDYTAHVYVSKFYSANFRVNNSFPAKFSFMNDTSFFYDNIDGVIKKTPKNPMTLYLYNNSQTPLIPSDTISVWPLYYNYTYDNQGNKIDSALAPADQTLERVLGERYYFNNENTYRDDYEIMRYITPYGGGVDLGEGYTWVIDVSDFAQLLSGKVYLHATRGGWGDLYDQNVMEDLELTFDFIEGTPARNLIKTTRLYNLLDEWYNSSFEEKLPPINYSFAQNEKQAILKIIQSGHGFGASADNCAEFCKKDAYVKIDGNKLYTRTIWRECGDNPIYPQGGTWFSDRTNWCPGADVEYHNYELTGNFEAGNTHTIDYDMQSYNFVRTDEEATAPNWAIRGYLMTYDEPNYQRDARFVEIKTPSILKNYNRLNPTIGSPIIVIQNTGSEQISSISFRYGNDPQNMVQHSAAINPPLKIMETRELILPHNNWYKQGVSNVFNIEILSVNNLQDEYASNNKATSVFSDQIDQMPTNFMIDLKTNNSNVLGINTSPYFYKVLDLNGNVVFEKKGLKNNTTYNDEMNLPKGHYSFIVENFYGYGFGFWLYANQYGLSNATLRFSKNGVLLKAVPTDWGNSFRFSFSTDEMPTMKSNIQTSELEFGKIEIGSKVSREIKVFPANEKGLSITDITLPFATNKKFSILKEESTSSNPRELSLGDTLTLTVEFQPLSKGEKTSTLQITSNDKYNSPLSILLIGQGDDPTSVEEEPVVIDMSLKAIDNSFSEVTVNHSSNLNFGEAFLSDYLGNKLMSLSPESSSRLAMRFIINTELLPNGIYFFSISTPQGIRSIKVPVVR